VGPLYVASAAGTRWLELILIGASIVSVVLAVGLNVPGEEYAALGWIIVAIVLPTDAILWIVIPRRYELYADRLRIEFTFFGWDIPFSSIESARPALWWHAYAYAGIRLATSPGQAIEVRRRGGSGLMAGMNLIISPEGRAAFLDQLQGAIENAASSPPPSGG
jgi:hypothetical protein